MKARVALRSFSFLTSILLLLSIANSCGSSTTQVSTPPKGIPPDAAHYIAYENTKPGTTDWILQNASFLGEIEGYADATSVNRGGQIAFYINTASPSYTIQFFRMGWYGGNGARSMGDAIPLTGQVQPKPVVDAATGLLECPWKTSYTLTVPIDSNDPTNWLTGLYVAKLVTTDTHKERFISFFVRDDASTADILFNSGSATFQAYNNWGGKSLYGYNSTNLQQAVKVSYNRPFVGYGGAGHVFQYEYNSIRFLEQNGYYVTYATDTELHNGTEILTNHKAFVNMSHDEYYTWQMKNNVQAARDAGVNIGYFTADEMNWQMRFEPSPLTKVADRTQVEYRDALLDPYDSEPAERYLVTTAFRDPPVNAPEEDVFGEMFSVAVAPNVADYTVQDGSSWVFAGMGVSSGSLLPRLVGREIDHNFGVAPFPVDILARGTILDQNGKHSYADMTVFQAPSGATVFAAGSLLWPWTLDSFAYTGEHANYQSVQAQIITKNVLSQFGASPHSW